MTETKDYLFVIYDDNGQSITRKTKTQIEEDLANFEEDCGYPMIMLDDFPGDDILEDCVTKQPKALILKFSIVKAKPVTTVTKWSLDGS